MMRRLSGVVFFYEMDGGLNLVDFYGRSAPIYRVPTPPLLPVKGPEFPFFIGPRVPNGRVLRKVVIDVGRAAQKPEKFPQNGIEKDFFGRQKREALTEEIGR